MQHPTLEPRVTNAGQPHPLSREHLYSRDEEEDIDEEDEQLGLVPRRRRRTPHSEAYHALPPESIDSFATHQDIHFRGFLPWLSGRNTSHRHFVSIHLINHLGYPLPRVRATTTYKCKLLQD